MIKALLKALMLSATYSQIIRLPLNPLFGPFETSLSVADARWRSFELNLATPFLWITKDYFERIEKENITVHGIETVEYKGRPVEGIHLESSVEFANSLVEKIHYFAIEFDELESQYESFPLALNYYDDKFNFIKVLKKNNKISREVFGFLINRRVEGTFYIGGFDDLSIRFPYQTKLKVPRDAKKWGFKMHSIEFMNKTFTVDKFVMFQSSDISIYASEEFMKMVNETFFNEYFEKGVCEYMYSSQWERIYCQCSNFNNLDINITFNLGDRKFELNKYYLFDNYFETGDCPFNIEINKQNKTEFILGTPFLSAFPMLFDYEDKSITFYSETLIPKSSLIEHSIIFYIILCVIASNILGVLNLIFLKCKI